MKNKTQTEAALQRPRSAIGAFTLASFALAATGTALSLGGCESRDEQWDTGTQSTAPVALAGSVALLDESLHRIGFLHSEESQSLSTQWFTLGSNVTTAQASKDAQKLFVLSSGVFPRTKEDDERPRLQVFDGGTRPKIERTFILDDPMKRLALDPKNEWVAAYLGEATVTNPNELVLLSLTDQSDDPLSRTIRSFGGAPEELLFTDELTVPRGGARRFLVVRTDRDLTLVDLKNLDESEITVRLPQSESGVAYAPLQIIYSEGDPDDRNDSRFAVRMAGSSDVVLLSLGPSEDSAKDFTVTVNIVDVGGPPSTIDFVQTDGGLRLAALVPSAQIATLVNPTTTLAEQVELPHRFENMTRITELVDETPDGGDVALLWGNSSQIAFWSLGSTSSTPYRSVDSTELDMVVDEVLDVPPPNEHLKVLAGYGGSGFFVLDLKKRQSFPLNTAGGEFDVQVSLDGRRLWVSRPYFSEFSSINLSDLHPQALFVSPAPSHIFDIERKDGERSAIALVQDSGWSATVLDGTNPDSSKTSFYPALHLGGLQ